MVLALTLKKLCLKKYINISIIYNGRSHTRLVRYSNGSKLYDPSHLKLDLCLNLNITLMTQHTYPGLNQSCLILEQPSPQLVDKWTNWYHLIFVEIVLHLFNSKSIYFLCNRSINLLQTIFNQDFNLKSVSSALLRNQLFSTRFEV
jgi:hypothetical protein